MNANFGQKLTSPFAERCVHNSVLSDRDNFQFAPSNPWVAFGERTAEDISISMEKACKAGRVEYVPGMLVKVDAEALKAHVDYRYGTTAVLDYDYLVGATGPKLDWNGIIELYHGPQEDVAAVSVCSTPHCVRILSNSNPSLKSTGYNTGQGERRPKY
jgi:sulfide:quinone oxidoreductase